MVDGALVFRVRVRRRDVPALERDAAVRLRFSRPR
jgi:hypothetical protein